MMKALRSVSELFAELQTLAQFLLTQVHFYRADGSYGRDFLFAAAVEPQHVLWIFTLY